MRIKTISLRQPYASLIAAGMKSHESYQPVATLRQPDRRRR